MEAGKVSVVMCTYNGQAFLRQQLDSILAQTYHLYEILIFDDHSTDDTIKILEEYAVTYPVILFKKNEQNLGFAANFKQALLAATGDLIAISDQDDVWSPNKIEKMVAGWKGDSLLIYCDSIRFTNKLPLNPVPDPNYRRFEGKDGRKISLFNTVSGHAIILKKELLDLALPFDEHIFYDWWLAVVAAYNGGVSYVDEVLVFQRVHSKNVSIGDGLDHTQKEQRNGYKQLVIKHLIEFKKAPNIPERDKKFIKRLTELLKRSLEVKFFLPLFIFMVQHRKLLFYHKKKQKKVNLFSYIKYSYRLVFNYDY
jgi:glycosyltransferase involved in cell wall biosynthesis